MGRQQQTVFLVACVKTKADGPRPARDLYLSDWFRKARAYAEAQSDLWFILSAAHGLLSPERVVAPYEQTLNRMSADARREWAARVLEQVPREVAPGSDIVVLAGKAYRQGLVEPLRSRGYRVDVPMVGLGIGKQLAWLKSSGRSVCSNSE